MEEAELPRTSPDSRTGTRSQERMPDGSSRRLRSVSGAARRDVVEDLEVGAAARPLRSRERDRLGRASGLSASPAWATMRIDARALVELGQDQEMVRQDRLHRLRDPLEHLAHVERLGERVRAASRAVEPLAAPALGVPDPPVLDRRAEQRRDRPQHLLVLVGEGVRLRRR